MLPPDEYRLPRRFGSPLHGIFDRDIGFKGFKAGASIAAVDTGRLVPFQCFYYLLPPDPVGGLRQMQSVGRVFRFKLAVAVPHERV